MRSRVWRRVCVAAGIHWLMPRVRFSIGEPTPPNGLLLLFCPQPPLRLDAPTASIRFTRPPQMAPHTPPRSPYIQVSSSQPGIHDSRARLQLLRLEVRVTCECGMMIRLPRLIRLDQHTWCIDRDQHSIDWGRRGWL